MRPTERSWGVLLAVAAIAIGALAGGDALARRHRRRPPPGKVLVKASGPATVTLESIDLAQATAVVRLTGVSREPDGRLFALHDDHDRHFIALGAHCAAAADGPSVTDGGAREPSRAGSGPAVRCTLDLPRPYLGKARIVAMTAHVGGRELQVAPAELEQRLAEARGRLPDGGVPRVVHRRAPIGARPRGPVDGGAPDAEAPPPPEDDGEGEAP